MLQQRDPTMKSASNLRYLTKSQHLGGLDAPLDQTQSALPSHLKQSFNTARKASECVPSQRQRIRVKTAYS